MEQVDKLLIELRKMTSIDRFYKSIVENSTTVFSQLNNSIPFASWYNYDQFNSKRPMFSLHFTFYSFSSNIVCKIPHTKSKSVFNLMEGNTTSVFLLIEYYLYPNLLAEYHERKVMDLMTND